MSTLPLATAAPLPSKTANFHTAGRASIINLLWNTKILVCVAAFALLAGCATPVVHQTASGKPEVTIDTENVIGVKEALVSRMINRRYNLISDSDYQLVFDRPIENFLAGALLGSRYDSTPNARITYTLAVGTDSVRIVADLAIITNPGSAFERRMEMNSVKDSMEFQEMLNQLRDTFSYRPKYY